MTVKEIKEVVAQFILEGNTDENVAYTDLIPKIEDSTKGPYNNLVVIQDVSGKQLSYCSGNSDVLLDLIIYHDLKEQVSILREQLEEDLDNSCTNGLRLMSVNLEETYLGIEPNSNLHVCKTRISVLT